MEKITIVILVSHPNPALDYRQPIEVSAKLASDAYALGHYIHTQINRIRALQEKEVRTREGGWRGERYRKD